MNGFEVYKIYLAIKLHFTSKNQSYDFHKHNGRTTARLETFTKRRDRYFFHKLSKSYNDSSIVNYFLSNFVSNTNLWVGDIIGKTGDDNYKQWSKKLEALHYYYEQDIDYILGRDIKFDDLFLVKKSSSDSELLQLDGLEQKFFTTIPLAWIFSDSKSSTFIPVFPICG